MIYNNVTS